VFGGKPLKWTFRVGDQPPTLEQGVWEADLEREQEFRQVSESLLSARCQRTLSLPSGGSDRPQGPWQTLLQRHLRMFYGVSITTVHLQPLIPRAASPKVRRSDQRVRDARVFPCGHLLAGDSTWIRSSAHRQRPLACAALLLSDLNLCPQLLPPKDRSVPALSHSAPNPSAPSS